MFPRQLKKCLAENNLNLEALSRLTADAAYALVDKNKGEVKSPMNKLDCIKTNDILIVHSLIHQQNLCVQILPMNHVMNVVIKKINYIGSLKNSLANYLLNMVTSYTFSMLDGQVEKNV